MNTTSAAFRSLVGLLRSPRSRQQLAQVWAALTLLGPVLLLAFDHHGAERLPNHVHLTAAGQSVPGPLHGFQVPHVDRRGENASPSDETAIVAAAPAAVLVLTLAQTVGLLSGQPPVAAS